MARNLIDLIDFEDEDIERFEKLTKSNKPHFNPNVDNKEKIKKQRREKQKMRENAYKDNGDDNVL